MARLTQSRVRWGLLGAAGGCFCRCAAAAAVAVSIDLADAPAYKDPITINLLLLVAAGGAYYFHSFMLEEKDPKLPQVTPPPFPKPRTEVIRAIMFEVIPYLLHGV